MDQPVKDSIRQCGVIDDVVPMFDGEKANKIITAKLPGHGFSRKPKKFNYLLSGILKCGKCGTSHISISSSGHTGKRFAYYMCGRSKQKLGCDTSAVPAGVFDKALIDYFKKASEDRSIIVNAIGSAMQEAQVKVEKLETVIKEMEAKLQELRIEARNLLDLAAGGTVAQGVTFKTKMGELDDAILKLEDGLQKMYAQKAAGEMSANSGQFLHETLQFAMKHIDKAPEDAQKSLIRALIKELVIHDDHIDVKMYIGQPESILEAQIESDCTETSPTKKKRPAGIATGEALTNHTQNAYDCQQWLPGRYSDSGLLWHFTALVTEQGKWNHLIISIVREGFTPLEITGDKQGKFLTGQAPDEARRIHPKPPKTYRNPIFRAKEYARMLESGQAKNESDLARKVGISRVRIWQYTSLLDLNPSLVEAVEALGDPMPKRLITERQLRQMLKDPKEQENFISQLQLSRNP